MQWIILIGDTDFDFRCIKEVIHYGSLRSYEVEMIPRRYCVEYENDHIFYDYCGDFFPDYEENDLKKIPFEEPRFMMMLYTSPSRVREVLVQENFIRNIYIDNDHGVVLPLEEFIRQGMPLQ